MAAGRRPFTETQGPRLIDAILNREPATPRSLNRWISPALENIILKALDKNPEPRYQSVRDLRVDLERLGAPPPVAAPARSRRPLALLWPLAIAGALAVLLVTVFFLVRRRQPAGTERIQSLAVLPLENLSGDPAQDYFADGMTEALIATWRRSARCA